MNKLIFLFSLLFALNLHAQSKSKDTSSIEVLNSLIKKQRAECLRVKNVKCFDEIMANPNYMDTPEKVSLVYFSKAYLLSKIYRDSMRALDKSDARYQKMLSEVNGNYEKAIQTCIECSNQRRINRLRFLKSIKETKNPIYLTDLEMLKKKGYKQDIKGLSLGLKYMNGNKQWFGINTSLLSFYSPSYRLKDVDIVTNKTKFSNKNSLPLSLDIFNFGYAYSPNSKVHDFTIDFIKFKSPIYLNPTQIGWQYWSEEGLRYGFYRPEIGLGWGPLTFTYSYNLMFNKAKRAEAEKHLFNVHLSYPIIKYKD